MSLNRILVLNDKTDAVDTPPPGKIYFYLDGSSLKFIESSGTVNTLATGVSPEDVQDIVGTFIQSQNNRITLNYNDASNILELTLVEGNIVHQNLGGAGTNTHTQIDSHISNTSNPHATTAAQVGAYTMLQTDTQISAAVAAHEAASDPHPQYETSAEAQAKVDAHANLTNNPHEVTKAQIGLGNVDNTSDVNKPISTATQTALDLKYDASNPNSYETPAQLNARDTSNRSRTNHTGAQTASTISDFAASVLATMLSGFVVGVNTAILATDTVLAAFGKIQSQLNQIFSVLSTLIIGDNFEQFLDSTPFSTTSAANQVAASFTTTSKDAGLYRIGMNWRWTASTTTADAIFGLYVDGVLQDAEHNMELKDATTNKWQYQISYITLTSGVHTIQLRARNEIAGNTLTVSLVRAEMWRAN